jgi:hypothetical protein
MKTNLESRLLLGGLVFILLFGMAAHAESIRPAGGSPMVPLRGLISSWFRRNGTYRNAEDLGKPSENAPPCSWLPVRMPAGVELLKTCLRTCTSWIRAWLTKGQMTLQ